MILVVGTLAPRGFPQHNLLGDGYNFNSFFIELSESEIITTTNGVSRSFLNRWARRTIAGTPNPSKVVQHLVNLYLDNPIT